MGYSRVWVLSVLNPRNCALLGSRFRLRVYPVGRRVMITSMQSSLTRVVIGVALLICLVCPLLEVFDHWDNTLQTGNDTEYALVILSLCIGSAFCVARLILTIHRQICFNSLTGFSGIFSLPSSIKFPFLSLVASPPFSLRI